MVDILHRIGVKDVTPKAAYEAIATCDGIASWWIGGTSGDDTVGGTLDFGADIKAKVAELRPAERIDWEVIQGPDEWIGTHITFDIKQDGDYTIILLKHQGWAEPVEFMHHCSTKWGVFMVSLKQLLETGTGSPTPHDTHIDNWS
jgi:hypothetical protein